MSEIEVQPTYQLSFQPTETFSSRTNQKNVHIGNSGGKYEWKDGDDHFQQHFAPDGSWDPAERSDTQRKHSTLYPAVLWKFLEWQNGLEASDPRKNVAKVTGSTNETMSNFRAKLLGDAYSHQRVENSQDPSNPQFKYEIDLIKLRQNERLTARLKNFYDKARKMDYMMTTPVPKPGEVPFLSITVDELS